MSVAMTEAPTAILPESEAALLSVRGLTVRFPAAAGSAIALDGVSFDLRRGETLALVGESGSGKSLTALAVMGLLPSGASVTAGQVRLDGRDLIGLSNAAMNDVRGVRIGMVFQEPMTSLNPVLTIGRQLTEGLEVHRGFSAEQARGKAIELLTLVGIADAAQRLRAYPHQLSGGMRQRVMIAMAVACEPALIIADEPTTALDVSIQAQVISLLLDLRHRLGTAVFLITHDLGVVAEMADRIAVMYAGHVVEIAGAVELFDAPRHPYTEGLLAAVPRLDELVADRVGRARLAELPGSVPAITARPPGCPFNPRCKLAGPRCTQAMPPMTLLSVTRAVACWERSA
jgi:peptide/nickel transport system ATP-binding protein